MNLQQAKNIFRDELKEISGIFGFGLTACSVVIYVLTEDAKNAIIWNKDFIKLNKKINSEIVVIRKNEQ